MKPYNIYVTVSFPPDTDTPGLQDEIAADKVFLHYTATVKAYYFYTQVHYLLSGAYLCVF